MSEKDTNKGLPLLLSVRNVPELGISKNEFYRIAHMETAPVVQVGSRLYLRRDEFLTWISQPHPELAEK